MAPAFVSTKTTACRRFSRSRAFSLVELVLVIVILGIMSAIAVPRLSQSSQKASESALRADLRTIRDAIDRYYCEHGFVYPGVKSDGLSASNSNDIFIRQLMLYSNKAGKVSVNHSPDYPLGPYIRGEFPAITVGAQRGSNNVMVVDSDSKLTYVGNIPNVAWLYSKATGQFVAYTPDNDSNGEPYIEY